MKSNLLAVTRLGCVNIYRPQSRAFFKRGTIPQCIKKGFDLILFYLDRSSKNFRVFWHPKASELLPDRPTAKVCVHL